MSNNAYPNPKTGGGLTKREYYAAHAPITVGDAREYIRITSGFLGDTMKVMAQMRFDYADAMLAADKDADE